MIPKLLNKITLQLITPCFCAGAEQTQPELRAPSFRGELRWWFRCLGGSKAQENAVFGNAAGDSGNASSVALLVRDVKTFQSNYEREFDVAQKEFGYITYFLTANENSDREDKVVRTNAYLKPGTCFTLELREIRPITEVGTRELLLLAWRCMCTLGAVGARKTRGLGAYAPTTPAECEAVRLLQEDRVKQYFEHRLIPFRRIENMKEVAATVKILTECSNQLKALRDTYKIHPIPCDEEGQKRKPNEYYGVSVLGNAKDGRQTSAVRYRPIINEKGEVLLCVLKAPACTLSEEALKHDIPTIFIPKH